MIIIKPDSSVFLEKHGSFFIMVNDQHAAVTVLNHLSVYSLTNVSYPLLIMVIMMINTVQASFTLKGLM